MACGELLQYLMETERNLILIHHFYYKQMKIRTKTHI